MLSMIRKSVRAGAAFLLAATLMGAVRTAGAAGAQGGSRPNILFVIADDWGWPHAGAYGATWLKTPAFDRVASEGVLFKNCFTSNPKCSPCRASILTGRNSWQTENAICHFGIFPKKWAVYPDLLEEAGYRVGFTGKGWGPGDFQAGGFTRNPAGPGFQARKNPPPAGGISNTDYAGNFNDFLASGDPSKPFCFWLGGQEPHRDYEPGSGMRAGKKPADVTVPSYLPDAAVTRNDMLDYAVEVEWFDTHLGRALKLLEARSQLDNTLIVVTSDHGMPFPRVKGQIYEHGFHVPLAIRWGSRVKSARTVDDFINVRDFAPTFLEAAGVTRPSSITGKSFLDVLLKPASGWVDRSRNRMLIGKERHDIGRPNDWGYPVRAIRTPEYLYVHNYHPERWPVGNPETNYPNCDNGPTKTFITFRFDDYYRLCFGYRPEEELYRVDEDSDCVKNLAGDPTLAALKKQLRTEMDTALKAEGDPRLNGNAAVFETYRYLGARTHAYDTWEKARGPAPVGTGARTRRRQ